MTLRQKLILMISMLLIIFNLILSPILFLNQLELLSIIMFTILLSLSVILLYAFFCDYTKNYPRNDKTEYNFNLKTDLNLIRNNTISFVRLNKGLWQCHDLNMKMDMSGYMFQKSYIRSFIIRQFQFAIVNKEKLPLRKILEPLDVKPFFEIKDLNIEFIYNKKINRKSIIRNYQTNVSFLIAEIISSRYGILGLGGKSGSNRLYTYEKISEDIYEMEKIPKPIFIKRRKNNKF